MTDLTNRSALKESAVTTLAKPSFDTTMHQPPRIDQFGFNQNPKFKLGDDGSNILKHADKIHIPDWWLKGTNGQKTRSGLIDERLKARRPDLSYDLDGDGFVGGRDYVISKIFDKDGDGKLNAEERKNADEAVRNVS